MTNSSSSSVAAAKRSPGPRNEIAGTSATKNLKFGHYPATDVAERLTGVVDSTGVPFAVRDRLTFRASVVFAIAVLLGLSNPPAGYSEPDEASEVWCKAHNSDPSAVSHCIEAEKGFGQPKQRATEDRLKHVPLSGALPLPRPRKAAPHPTPEFVQQAADKPQQSAPMPTSMTNDQVGPSDARFEE
jgi:hypothetical protein